MKKKIFTLVLLATSFFVNAQQSTDFGFNLGTSNYLGDLQTNNYSYKWPGFATGFFVKQNLNPFFSVRGFLNYGRISGQDNNTLVQGQISRNLSFRSYIVEMGVVGEINLIPFDARNRQKYRGKRFNFTPYIFGGINLFHFNPKAFYNNQWVALQPLCTEGQETSFNTQRKYSLTQVGIPIGFGFKYQATKQLTVGVEFGARKTFTDYLDDVSGNYPNMTKLASEKGNLSAALSYRGDEVKGYENTTSYTGQGRGNASNMDWYLMNTITVSYKLANKCKSRY